MPVVVIHGLPERFRNDPALRQLALESIPEAIAGVAELGLKPGQVSTFFPCDLLQEGLGEEIVALVEGVLEKPERTPWVIARTADAVRRVMREFVRLHLPECRLIEVFLATRAEERVAFWLEPSSQDLADACAEVVSAEACQDLASMPIEEGLAYALTLLEGWGIDNPADFLAKKGILE